jgi:hypothetical protein
MVVQLGGKGHRGLVAGGGRELPTAAGGCRRAVRRRAPGDAAAAAWPRHGGRLGPIFAVSSGQTSGMRSRVALPSLLADEMPVRQGPGCASLDW